MSDFDRALPIVLGHEGGFVNDPDDRGGATNYGVTQGTYDEWRRAHSLPTQPVADIDVHEVKKIYLTYWEGGRCDDLPWPVSMAHFDACINHGPANAIKFLQRAVHAADDGKYGPKTSGLVHGFLGRHGGHALLEDILWKRLRFYFEISEGSQLKFLRGWLLRTIKIRERSVL
jgi:lysozyme family protein